MKATCPECGAQGHVNAFFVEEDGKRLAVTLAGMQPELGKAVLGYLGLFKPAKTSLRLSRAAKIAQEVAGLVEAGHVCKDERSGVRRPTSPAAWAAGIEQMLAQRYSLTLPLESHGYLRAVVYGLADKADAAAERQREADARAGRHLAASPSNSASEQERKLEDSLYYIQQQLGYGAITADEAEHQREAAYLKYGGGP
ncbi:MAG: hypothetical protein ACRER3_04270 [Pseudomonas fluorescens]